MGVDAQGSEARSEVHLLSEPKRAIAWQEWGEEAFAEARSKRVPILLDISAVWCHWCHVMDETTYRDTKVIEIIESEFVAIKVDNDLRPDVNTRYNQGGWPSTVFLTPSGDVLTGATYLSATQMEEALKRVLSYWRTHQMEIASASLEARRRGGRPGNASSKSVSAGIVEDVIEICKQVYDPVDGGFGREMKFPLSEVLLFLSEQAQLKEQDELKQMAAYSLGKMVGGGMYDQVEGGFFRYSTTRDWSVPHYEKMLEDHAGLVNALALSGMDEALDKTVRYLEAGLRVEASKLYGGSQDADEEYYKLSAKERRGRKTPQVDGRIYTAWNAQMAVSYLEAAVYARREGLKERAREMLEELLAKRYRVGVGWEHAEGTGGQLGDQVWGLLGALRAYEWGLGKQWWEGAKVMARQIETDYGDSQGGGYFDILKSGEGRLGEKMKHLNENALMATALNEMSILSGEDKGEYWQAGKRALEAVAGVAERSGVNAAIFARAFDRMEKSVKVSTVNLALAEAAKREYPYVVVEPTQEEGATVCLGTVCVGKVKSEEEVVKVIRELRKQQE